MIHIIRAPATQRQLDEMGEAYSGYIKVVVDVQRWTLAGGGVMHADCEEVLLDDGSAQADLWGGGFDPETGEIDFYAIINIRPRDGSRTMEVQDPAIRERIGLIIDYLLGGGERR